VSVVRRTLGMAMEVGDRRTTDTASDMCSRDRGIHVWQ
jgi:hypothetical protein